MKTYKVEIFEIHKFNLEVEASSKQKAIAEAKNQYKNATDDYAFSVGSADLVDVKFKIRK